MSRRQREDSPVSAQLHYIFATTSSIVSVGVLGYLVFVERRLRRLIERMVVLLVKVEDEHEARSRMRTIAGLFRSLELGLEHGGYTAEQRRAIYEAVEEQFALLDSERSIGLGQLFGKRGHDPAQTAA
jgi:hypothetical protein